MGRFLCHAKVISVFFCLVASLVMTISHNANPTDRLQFCHFFGLFVDFCLHIVNK